MSRKNEKRNSIFKFFLNTSSQHATESTKGYVLLKAKYKQDQNPCLNSLQNDFQDRLNHALRIKITTYALIAR